MIIFGFDVSSTNIGVVTWDTAPSVSQVLSHQTITLKANDLGKRLLAGQAALQQLFPTRRPDLVAYEGPAYSKCNIQAVYAQAAMVGQLLALCAGLGIPVVAIAPSAAKKALSGSGKADKAEMVRCAAAYLSGDYSEHEADALGVALAAAAYTELDAPKPARPARSRKKVA